MSVPTHIIGYVIWNKPDMIGWLLEGIVKNVPSDRAWLWFQFDRCDDDTVEVFQRLAPQMLAGYRWEHWASDVELRELGGHNKLLERFLASDRDVLTVYQDDQRITGPILPDIDAVLHRYGERLGMIGGKDGFEKNEQDRACTHWSECIWGGRVLQRGETAERTCFNSGPIIYPRRTVERVGLLNAYFTAFQVWADYGHRCKAAGLTNVVMGTDLEHRKFGRCQGTWWYRDDTAEHDMAYMREHWGW
jgi:hypothetical protein